MDLQRTPEATAPSTNDAPLQAEQEALIKRVRAEGPLTLDGRELLALWGQSQKGYGYVSTIKKTFLKHGILSDHPIEKIDLPTRVTLKTLDPINKAEEEASLQKFSGELPARDLKSDELISVRPQDNLTKATSLMMRHDFSQLPVLHSKQELLGAVSWDSIGRARTYKDLPSLFDCIITARVVDEHSNLLDHMDDLTRDGFIFTRGRNRTLNGIVTLTDVGQAFRNVATPFLEIGAIEAILRDIAASHFPPSVLHTTPTKPERGLRLSVDDLTLGELVQLFSNDENWKGLNWNIDPRVFRQLLQSVTAFRNEFMHFRSTPSDDSRIADVRQLRRWLNLLG